MKKTFLLLLLVIILVWLLFFRGNDSAPFETQSEVPLSSSETITENHPVPTAPQVATETLPTGNSSRENSESVSVSDAVSETPETKEENDKGPESHIKELPVSEIPDILKRSEELEEISGLGFFVPGCYIGEFYPYPGKSDRFEVELQYTARGGSFSGKENSWKIYGNSYLVIKKLGEIFRDYGPEKFRKPPPLKKGTYGFLVVDPEQAIYQIVGEKGKIHITYFEKRDHVWEKLADARLSLASGPDCNSHGYPLQPAQ